MTQLEYEKQLAELNSERMRQLKPYRDQLDQIGKEWAEIGIQIKELHIKQDRLNQKRMEIARQQRIVDDIYKERKREMIRNAPDALKDRGGL